MKKNSIYVVAVAGWEVSLELSDGVWRVACGVWQNTLGRPQATGYRLQARSDFFAPVWEGMGGQLAGDQQQFTRLQWSYSGHNKDFDVLARLSAWPSNLANWLISPLPALKWGNFGENLLRSHLHSAFGVVNWLVSPLISFGGGGDGVGVMVLPHHPWQIRLSRRLEAQISMVLGVVMVGLGLFGVVLGGGPMVWVEARQVVKNVRVAWMAPEGKAEVKVVEQVTFADYVAFDPVVATITPASQDFSVVIPKIQVNSVVVAQVNTNEKTEYMAALKQGLAHAAGTSLPGQSGDTYIFGHSTDYEWNISAWNALFYNLKELTVGDKVYVWYQGMPKIYQVTETKILEPNDTSFINSDGPERLLLQTCYPPGTAAKRLVVFAQPVPVNNRHM